MINSNTKLKSKIRELFDAEWEVPEFNVELWQPKSHKYCLIIPVLNEGDNFKLLIKRIYKNSLHKILDIYIVDGGSSDGSIEANFLIDNFITGILFKKGAGKLSSQLRIGYAFAISKNYQGVITIDGNNRDDPRSIPLFIKYLNEGFDFLQASRFLHGGSHENTPVIRHFAVKLIHSKLLSLSSGFRWTDTTQGYRGYSSYFLKSEKVKIFRNIFNTYELLAYLSYIGPKLGFKCKEVATTRNYTKGVISSKIKGVIGHIEIFNILIRACLGLYNPKK